MVLFLYCTWCTVLTFDSVNKILKCDDSNEGYCAVLFCGALFTRYKMFLTFESVDEILKSDHSNQRY